MELRTSEGATAPIATLAHSEEFFGAQRDYWWNADFLDLLAQRWQLSQYQSLLDIGCGQCHWSRQLAPRMAPHAQITAYDRDPKWAAGSEPIRAAFGQIGASVRFAHGDAQQLPFDDNAFDLVSCQTVLMHLPDPLAALREMRRVVRPGGMVVCVEPCNLAQTAIRNALNADWSIEERCDAFRYALLCEQGKQAAGEGTLSLGDQLARLMQQAGFGDIRSCLSDKASCLLPPYRGEEAQANLNETLDCWGKARGSLWESQVRAWVSALHDPAASDFIERYHRQRAARLHGTKALIDAGNYWESGAALTFVVWSSK
ncbi:class I SAM-dependent methyltransferase [Chitinimonas sp.]|uniref:class I SAM-dependent methyltransferase n=1 Tax=Chitinimonas sp. TaxID=1934313 RepID=UPI0035AE9EAF